MKILFDHPNPFLLAHGGFQTQIEQTKAGLEAVGVEVEFLRWWDDRQSADIIHYFGRCSSGYISFAHQKGLKVVMEQLLTGLGSRTGMERFVQKWFMKGLEAATPGIVTSPFNWRSYRMADACIANTSWEGDLMSEMFGAHRGNVHILPNGVEEVFLENQTIPRGKWLVCTATITPRKRVLELSQAAVLAQVPVWILGRPYSDSDPYTVEFLKLAKSYPDLVRFEGPVNDRVNLAKIYRQARGFVLLSTMETRSLSSEEAAACRCPLLLSDLPWARSVFGDDVMYCPITSEPSKTADILRQFYELAPQMKAPPMPLSWKEVGSQLKSIYQTLL